jgi:hypothetical protein
VRDFGGPLATFPLLLWKTPPGLELILGQEGVAYETVKDLNPLALLAGRFVLFDSRAVPPGALRGLLTADHVPIDVDSLRQDEPVDPFAALVDHHTARACWTVGERTLTERVTRFPKAWIRRRLIGKLREAVFAAGGVWVRLAPFPYPYRSAFSFRADLDESRPDDYHRFARARGPLSECCTHFVSTNAYTHHSSVLRDLRLHDTQSHGHFHHVYRDPAANRINVERADRILRSVRFEPQGFAAPHGRWRPSLDDVLEDLGYLYSSDFQLGFDDFPFYPWKGNRFSRILQIPVHPVCEGLFLEAGIDDPDTIGGYLRQIIESKLDAGELAVVYGHPERRLGRMPEILTLIAKAIEKKPLVWRVTFTTLARWWRWRAERRWLIVPRGEDRLEVQLDQWNPEFSLALEIYRGRFRCSLPLSGPRMSIPLAGLAYERTDLLETSCPAPAVARRAPSLKNAFRAAIDWETVTPLDDIPPSTISNRLKRGLRWWKQKRAGVTS